MPKRRSDGGQRIIDGLNEVLAWTKGEASATIHFPGEPGREMTRDGYEAEKARRSSAPASPATGERG